MRLFFLSDSPADTLAGHMNIRSKLLICLTASLAAIVLSNPLALALLCGVSTVYALTALSLAGLLRAYVFFAFMCLVSLGFTWLASLSMPQLITWEAGRFAVPYMRMLISLNALLVLAFSSRIQDLMHELQAFGRMAWIHVPLTVAVRFLPTFLDDCVQVRDAFRLRSPLGRQGLWTRAAALWRGFLVPLTFRLLRSADDLAVAAELKGVGGKKRVSRPRTPFGRVDMVTFGVGAASLVLAVALQSVYGGSTNIY